LNLPPKFIFIYLFIYLSQSHTKVAEAALTCMENEQYDGKKMENTNKN
jgi:hypothetical protein